MKKITFVLSIIAMTAAFSTASFAGDTKVKEGSCCDKAAKKGEKCTMECCVAAAKDNKVCAKCNK